MASLTSAILLLLFLLLLMITFFFSKNYSNVMERDKTKNCSYNRVNNQDDEIPTQHLSLGTYTSKHELSKKKNLSGTGSMLTMCTCIKFHSNPFKYVAPHNFEYSPTKHPASGTFITPSNLLGGYNNNTNIAFTSNNSKKNIIFACYNNNKILFLFVNTVTKILCLLVIIRINNVFIVFTSYTSNKNTVFTCYHKNKQYFYLLH